MPQAALAKESDSRDEIEGVEDIAGEHYSAFEAGDCPLLDPPSEDNEEQRGADEGEEVYVGDTVEGEGKDGGASAEHEGCVEDIAADHVSDSEAGMPFDGCGH